jgi:D-mannonate dehydratase
MPGALDEKTAKELRYWLLFIGLVCVAIVTVVVKMTNSCESQCKRQAKEQLEAYGVPAVEHFREPYEMMVKECIPTCESTRRIQQATHAADPL